MPLCVMRMFVSALELPRQAEIHDDRLVPLVDHDVGRLQVAVHDPVVVGFLQRLRQLADDDQDLPLRLRLAERMKAESGCPSM